PIEPYLKRMSGSLVIHSGCASSRKNLYQAKAPPAAPSASSRSSATSRLRPVLRRRQRSRVGRGPGFVQGANFMTALLASEGLQVLDQRILVRGGQIGAIGRAFVTAVAVARQRGVEQEVIGCGLGPAR